MSYDAKKAAYQEVTILGRPALFAECRIDNSTVPKGLYRYELRHGDENWGDPVSLSRNIIVNYYGAVLTREPFQLPIEGWIPLEDDSLSFQDGGCRTLAEFQRKYPVSKKDVIDFFVANDDSLHDFYFSHSEAQDKATGCVGHLRGDFGSGKQFFTTWWPHQGDQLNTPAFKADIDRAVNWLREQPDSPLHDFDTMKRFCGRFERSCAIKGAMLPSYAFMAKTKQYVYMIRCTPVKGDYQHLVVDSSLCFQRPNKEFWFGTDNLGRDYWCQVWYATKTSIKLAALVAVGECLVGVTLGCIWGYVRKADRIFTEIYNIFVSVPTMIYMTLIALFIGQSFWVMCASIIFFHWMYMAKNVRNLVFIYRDREYNLASRCLGTRLSRVLTRNILPYLISVIILRVALSIPSTIGLETTLSYLGLGLDINIPSLGILLRNSRAFFLDYPYLLIFPAVIVSLVTITFYLAGNAFSDAADPRNHV